MSVKEQHQLVDFVEQGNKPLPPPPRWLMWLAVGGTIIAVLGFAISLLVFREVLRPGQQQRLIDAVPFMEAFLPYRPSPNAAVPTPVSNLESAISADDLLSISLAPTTTPSSTPLQVQAIVPTQVALLTSTVYPTSTPQLLPTTTPFNTVVPETTTPIVSNTVLPSTAYLNGVRHVQQTWNNCGPATITIALSYYGWVAEQEYAASFLKPDDEDKNVSPSEMVAFVNEQTGVRALTRMGGNLDLVKTLLSSEFPVVISIGYSPEGEDWLGHYRAIVGYDDSQQVFYAYDSYLGTGEDGYGIRVTYQDIERAWQQFNYNFIVLYSQEQEEQLRTVLGEYVDPVRAAEIALVTAQDQARVDPRDGFAWFNIGTALVKLERYEEAAVAFDQARRRELPWRMLWYQFGPYEAYFNVGRYDDVIALVNTNLINGGNYVEETYFWQGRVFAALGQTEQAAAAFRAALRQNPLFTAAQQALDTL
jgi:hypothetical protein